MGLVALEALSKIGSGTLTLTGANLYTAGTTVTSGTLVVGNTMGSATGTGAFLAPAHRTNKQVTLTIQTALTFEADSTYTYTFKANGVSRRRTRL